MRRYQKWLSLGLLALTPGITLAGPFSRKAPAPAPEMAESAASRGRANSNQQVAEQIAQSLRRANLSGYEIDIAYQNGVASLNGMVGSPEQKAAASRAVAGVKGVSRVDNRLGITSPIPKSGVEHASATMPRSASGKSRQPIRQINLETAAYESQEPYQVPAGESLMQPQAMPAQALPAGGPAPIPGYGHPGSGASHVVYNQPNMPNYAWPSTAQYPNYAAVTYPSQYAASAWPYIGPFYPYPQVPLGWRKAQLEWDDGYWNLNFRPRTDRWWWFLDWRNW